MKRMLAIAMATVAAIECVAVCRAQSLGEVARQEKSRKTASPPTAKRPVVTNDEIGPADQEPAETNPDSGAKKVTPKPSTAESREAVAAQLSAKIKQQKVKVNVLEVQAKQLREKLERWKTSDCTYTYHPNNPYGNACDVPQELSAAYDQTKTQLEQAHAALEQMQDRVRRQGFGVKVYDPD